jgi:hypothetical protein
MNIIKVFVFGFIACSLSFQTSAADWHKLFKNGHLVLPKSKNTAVPIRTINVNFEVHRDWVEKDAKNKLSSKTELVCTKKVALPVYNWTQQAFRIDFPDFCETTVDSLADFQIYKAKVRLGGIFIVMDTPEGKNERLFNPMGDAEFTIVEEDLGHFTTGIANIGFTDQVTGDFRTAEFGMYNEDQHFYNGQQIWILARLEEQQ